MGRCWVGTIGIVWYGSTFWGEGGMMMDGTREIHGMCLGPSFGGNLQFIRTVCLPSLLSCVYTLLKSILVFQFWCG